MLSPSALPALFPTIPLQALFLAVLVHHHAPLALEAQSVLLAAWKLGAVGKVDAVPSPAIANAWTKVKQVSAGVLCCKDSDSVPVDLLCIHQSCWERRASFAPVMQQRNGWVVLSVAARMCHCRRTPSHP